MSAQSPVSSLPSGWKIATLGEVTTKIGSGATPRGGESAYLPVRDRFALIRSQNVFDHRFETDGLAFISDKQAAELANAQVHSGDVLLNITGDGITFARACFVPDTILPACVNQHVSIVRANPLVLDSAYLAAYLGHPSTKGYIESFNAGGSRRAITKGHIEAFQLPLPTLDEQKRIGAVLRTINSKIEFCQRTNETLEAIAQTIFNSWFVDFDPVWAKAEGREPFGTDIATAALFPDSFQNSAIGRVPQGWGLGKLHDMIEIYGGGTPKTSVVEYWDGDVPWFSVVDAPRPSDVFVISTEKTITAAGLDNSSANILPEGTTIISARGTVGRLALVGRPMAMNQSCYGIRPKPGFGEYFTYFTLKSKIDELIQSTHGTVFDTITRDTFKVVEVIVPPDSLTRKFDDSVRSTLARILSNLRECKILAELRDSLLPKLMSAEIRVREFEPIAEATEA